MDGILNPHLNADDLERYAFNRLAEEQPAGVEEHLLLCKRCCDALTAIDEEIKLIRLALATSDRKPVLCV